MCAWSLDRNFDHTIMNAIEHSRLLYLLDALRCAPSKAPMLLRMARDPDASDRYSEILSRLNLVRDDIDGILRLEAELRTELRTQ